jgi:arylsulfatase A-like enzyme
MSQSPLNISTALLALSALAGNAQAKTPDEKPNVLFIVVDDLNDWIGPYGGHPQTLTPNMDRLAASGALTMMNAQCPATVCGPSRSSMMTGLRPSTTGVYGNTQNLIYSPVAAAVPAMSQYFSQNGYFSLSTGKIFHKHDLPEGGRDHGQWAFDLWEQETGSFKIDNTKLPLSGMPATGATGTPMDWGPTTVGKEQTVDWISAQWAKDKFQEDFDKPFFMMLGISKPHLSWYVPQEYFDRFGLDTLSLAIMNPDDLNDILTPSGKKKFNPSPDYTTIQQYNKFKEATRAYLACISYVDDCIGLVLDGLENSKYKDNTIIVLIGDHGWFLGEKLRFRKTHLWEESCRVPLIVKVPGVTTTAKCKRIVNLIDLYPTMAALCNLSPPTHCEGRNFAPLLSDPEKEWYPTLTTMGRYNHSVRSDRYRYNVWSDGTEELYDHETDSMEWNNLITNPQYNQVIADHKAYLPTVNAPNSPLVGITETLDKSKAFSLFPNPARNSVLLKTEAYTSNGQFYQLIDTNGKILNKKAIEGNETIIPIQQLMPGTYFIRVSDSNNQTEVLKFVKNGGSTK